MATKKEIAAECIEIAEKLELEITTEGLNHEKLSDLLADLKAKAKDAELETQADETEDDDSKAEWVIADGKSITSKKGVLDSGAEVKAEYLGGGEAAFKTLVEAKVIVEG